MRYDFYDKEIMYKPRLAAKCRDRLHRIILSKLKIRSICEIGVGFGEFADYCRRNKINWIGIESNEKLRKNLTKQGFKIYDSILPEFPRISEEFDVIFASHFIEHLNNLQEVLQFLERSNQILKSNKGRYLILLYPDIEKCGTFFWQDYTHSFVTTKKRIEDLLFDTGWRIVDSRRYTACFFKTSGLISFIGKIFPYFLLPQKIAMFARLSFQQHVVTIAEIIQS